jgi:hypothetical protein
MGDRGSNFGKGKIFSCFQNVQKLFWGLSSFLVNGYRVSFMREKLLGIEFDRSLPSSPAVKDGWRYISVPLILLRRKDGDSYIFCQKQTYLTWSQIRGWGNVGWVLGPTTSSVLKGCPDGALTSRRLADLRRYTKQNNTEHPLLFK